MSRHQKGKNISDHPFLCDRPTASYLFDRKKSETIDSAGKRFVHETDLLQVFWDTEISQQNWDIYCLNTDCGCGGRWFGPTQLYHRDVYLRTPRRLSVVNASASWASVITPSLKATSRIVRRVFSAIFATRAASS